MGNAFVFSSIFHNMEKTAKPSKGESLGNWFPVISYKIHLMWRILEVGTHTFPMVWVLFFSLDSHPTVYFITWEMHEISHQISHSIRKASETQRMGRPGKLVPILFP